MAKRTKLKNRILPTYTKGEEIFNMVSHIVGGSIGVLTLIACILISALKHNVIGIITSTVFGVSMIALYSISSIYHGLHEGTAKKVLQVLDHCTIYFLIAGTYTPILLCSLIRVSPVSAWITFGVVWGLTAFATTLTAIDLKKFKLISMLCYIGIGWSIIFSISKVYTSLGKTGFFFLLSGGILYTIGANFYNVGKNIKYFHSVFHLFVLAGSILHAVCVIFYVLL